MKLDLTLPATLISERMGLLFPEERWPELARGLTKAAASLGFERLDELVARLRSNNLGLREVQALAAHLTVPETYFFRSPETFAMLESTLLPQLIAERRPVRKLRIWSAGCASGPEPFSVAILVSRLVPDFALWDITILGTDINPVVLAVAKEARFTQWSFRGTPAWVMDRYFNRTQDGRYQLAAAIRDMVTFRYLNLVEDVYPLEPGDICDFDLILCRNVMMYFSRETMARVSDKLRGCLREGGCMLVSPSEVSREVQGDLVADSSNGETVYRRTTEPPAQLSSAAARHPAPTRRPPAKRSSPRAPSRVQTPDNNHTAGQRPGPRTPVHGKLRGHPKRTAQEARMLADRGDLSEALFHCESALETDKLDPSLHYLKASILQALGRADEAERALQSTLFLDGNFALARVMLGAIARGQSRPGDASKHFQEALMLLERMPSDSVLPETDGLTAGKMAETVASLIESECVL
jgi:chemotaxis protein methyltransferase CheR